MRKVLMIVLTMFSLVSCSTVQKQPKELTEVEKEHIHKMEITLESILSKIEIKDEKDERKVEQFLFYTMRVLIVDHHYSDEEMLNFFKKWDEILEVESKKLNRKLNVKEARESIVRLYVEST